MSPYTQSLGPKRWNHDTWTLRNFIVVLKSLWMVKTSIWPGESDWCLFKDHKSNFWWFLKCHSYQFWTCTTLALRGFYSYRILYNLQYNKRPKNWIMKTAINQTRPCSIIYQTPRSNSTSQYTIIIKGGSD